MRAEIVTTTHNLDFHLRHRDYLVGEHSILVQRLERRDFPNVFIEPLQIASVTEEDGMNVEDEAK